MDGPTRLNHLLAKTILVGLPNLAGDLKPVPFKLAGIEDCGLWLQEMEESKSLAPHRATHAESLPQTLLVPYAQIAYVIPEGMPAYLSLHSDVRKHGKRTHETTDSGRGHTPAKRKK